MDWQTSTHPTQITFKKKQSQWHEIGKKWDEKMGYKKEWTGLRKDGMREWDKKKIDPAKNIYM